MVDFTVIEGDFNKGEVSYDANLCEFYFFSHKAVIALKHLVSITVVQDKDVVTFTLGFSDGKKALCQSSNNDYLRLKYIFDNKRASTNLNNGNYDSNFNEALKTFKIDKSTSEADLLKRLDHSGAAIYMGTKKSKTVAFLLTLFLGIIGAQDFYLGRIAMGVICVLLCWTGLPLILAFIDLFLISGRVDNYNRRILVNLTSKS